MNSKPSGTVTMSHVPSPPPVPTNEHILISTMISPNSLGLMVALRISL